ncbi:hypothetical protein RhiirA5_384858, partial [Rhizophagus irregularis]
DLINAYNLTNGFQQDPNEVLYQVSETTTSPEPEVLSDTTSENSEKDIPQLHVPLPPIYNTPNNPAPVILPLNNMAQPNQQDFQQLRVAIAALTQALPNTKNALVGNTQAINNPLRREEVVPAYLKGAASTWWNTNQALPNGNLNRIIAWTELPYGILNPNQPGEDVNTYAAALQELYRRVETNAFVYPDAIKVRKFVNGLLPDLYVTVKPHNDQTWNGAVDRAKAYELTHKDQHAVNAYLNKFAPSGTGNQSDDLLKAINELTKQVQNLSTGNRGNRGYNNSSDFRNTSQSTTYTPNRQNQIVCYSCGQSGHIVRYCLNGNNNDIPNNRPPPPINNNGNTSNNNTTVPQPANDSGQQLAQIQQMTTCSMSRLNPLEGTLKENPTEEENVLRATQQVNKSKRPINISDVRQTEAKRIVQKGTKKKLVTVAPINKMVELYTPQQFFDQKADITNGQLLAMNPKFGLTIAKQLRKPVVRKRDDDQDKKTIKMVIDEVTQENGNTPEVNDLLQLQKTKAILNYDSNVMVIKWQDETFEVATECREMPQHIVSIEVPDLEVDEDEEEAANESEEEKVKIRYYWLQMFEDVRRYVRTCDECQRRDVFSSVLQNSLINGRRFWK